jgi:hypothetical protein
MRWSEPEPQREHRPRAADPLAGLAEELSRVPAAPEPSSVESPPRLPFRREPRPPRPQPAQPPKPAAAPEAQLSSSADQNLAEMAQRLEAALRRPAAKADDARAPQPAPKTPAQPAPEPMHDEIEEEPPPPAPTPRVPTPPESLRPQRGDARPARAETKPAPQKSLYDSLEQEMASLLGRPDNKP